MDYLNGLQSHSITDMLPDRPLVQPCEDTYTRGGKVVRVGYYNYICANPECGKAFEATQQHKYKASLKEKGVQRIKVYCSYKCFRPIEKYLEDRYKAECFGFVQCNGAELPPTERAKKRVEKCEKRIQDLMDEINDPVRFKALTKSQKHTRKALVQEWRRKLAEAKETYEQMKEMEMEFEP